MPQGHLGKNTANHTTRVAAGISPTLLSVFPPFLGIEKAKFPAKTTIYDLNLIRRNHREREKQRENEQRDDDKEEGTEEMQDQRVHTKSGGSR